MIEELYNPKLGFHLFEMTEDWQVWELQYCDAQTPEKISIMTMYPNADRTFTLLEGEAFLIAMEHPEDHPQIIRLQSGRTYQICSGLWHNVSMKENARILVTENMSARTIQKQFQQISDKTREIIKLQIENII